MNIPDVRMRFNGIAVGEQSPLQVVLPPSTLPPSSVSNPLHAEQVRAQLAHLGRSDVLTGLRQQFAGHRIRAALAIPGESPFVFRMDPSLQGHAIGSGDIRIGCGVKLIVSSALHDQISSGRCSLRSSIWDMLGIAAIQGIAGSALVMEDLLNHRHGLEDDGIRPNEFIRNGRIDTPSLVSLLNRKSPRLGPGRHYSYSRAGYWLVAAALQDLHERSISEILASHGVRLEGDICPAMGNGARIPGMDLLRFLVERVHRAAAGTSCAPLPPDGHNVVPLPGWHVIESGMQCGWKVFQKGWLGHNVTSAEERGMIRVHPATGAALYVWAPAAVLPRVAARIFGTILPESLPPRIPRRLHAAEWSATDQLRYVGSFRSAAGVMKVRQADNNGLTALWQYGPDPERSLTFRFAPAERDIFFTVPVRQLFLPFIQFISASSGSVEGIWNGRRFWPKVEAG